MAISQAPWHEIKMKFVTGDMRLTELAREYGLKESTVRNQAHRNGWQAERDAIRHQVTERASESLLIDKVAELAQLNGADLKLSKNLRELVFETMALAKENAGYLRPSELRSLASAAEVAQRIGRLALGVSTDNHQHTGVGGGPVGVSSVPLPLYEEACRKALEDY